MSNMLSKKTRAFVVADAHGNYKAVKGLLKQEGLHRLKNWETTHIVQLGDLLNCVEEDVSKDLRTLDDIAFMFDHMLVGNHEHPYWPGYIQKFGGFHFEPTLAEKMQKFEYTAAFAFGGVLVTHAGLAKHWELTWDTAKEAARDINEWWSHDPSLPIFNSIGRMRGGSQQQGGILWCHSTENKSRKFSQVFGHTPGDIRSWKFTKYGDVEHLCIDLGAKKEGKPIAGAWIEEDGTITPVTYDPAKEPTIVTF